MVDVVIINNQLMLDIKFSMFTKEKCLKRYIINAVKNKIYQYLTDGSLTFEGYVCIKDCDNEIVGYKIQDFMGL